MESYLSDPSLHSLAVSSAASHRSNRSVPPLNLRSAQMASSPVSTTMPPVSTSVPAATDALTPTDLLLSTPPPVLKLLTLTAPLLHSGAILIKLITWQHENGFASLLVLLGWWAVCLLGRVVALYGANLVLVLYIAVQYVAFRRAKSAPQRPRSTTTLTPATYSTLLEDAQFVAAHLAALRAHVVVPVQTHLSFTPFSAGKSPRAFSTAYIALSSYPFYLALTWFLGFKYILLAAGSIVILWEAPFFKALRVLLWRSAAIRWACRITLAILSGGRGLTKEFQRRETGLGVAGLLKSKKKDHKIEEKPVQRKSSARVGELVDSKDEDDGGDVQLQLTVFENQRWWVGLDWTHALLPGERASW